MTAAARKPAAIGRETKISKLPAERMSDWRSASSIIGPITIARIKGAPS